MVLGVHGKEIQLPIKYNKMGCIGGGKAKIFGCWATIHSYLCVCAVAHVKKKKKKKKKKSSTIAHIIMLFILFYCVEC